MRNMTPNNSSKKTAILWVGAGVLAVALLFARAVYSEYLWLTAVIGVALVADLAILMIENKKALQSRQAAYGLNSIVTVLLVIGIIGVVNFLAKNHEFKADLTKNKLHTLSDQSIKVVKTSQKAIKAVLFGKAQQREQYRPLLDNFKILNPKFEIEYVDPDREPTRAKQVGIKKYGTLQLVVGTRDSKIEEPTEEKLTNALIKLLKERTPTLCAITGHGEKSFASNQAEGYEAAKKGLADQSYEVKDVNILQEQNKIPENCDAIAILGPNKSFFEPEMKAIQDYLANGGRALIATDINLKGEEFAPQMNALLTSWYVKPATAMIVDPLSRMLGVDASVPILASFSKENPITRDFSAQNNCYFPFARPLDIVPGAPAGMTVQWIGQTTPKSWAVGDLKSLESGQVAFQQGRDKMGPLNAAVAVEGKLKDSKAARPTRIVAFGTSYFATNNFSRYGSNLDFFLNSVSWVMEDESLISIRGKEEGPGKVELSQKQGTTIFLLTVIIIPLIVAASGIGIWAIRRRL